jgi:hypothetical protein
MQVLSNGRVRGSEGEWREFFSRWKKSGLSVREFCRQEDLRVSSFQRWQQRLRGSSARADFVRVLPAPSPAPSAATWTVEVTLPDGSRLRFQG